MHKRYFQIMLVKAHPHEQSVESASRKKLNMFNFRRQVERPSNKYRPWLSNTTAKSCLLLRLVDFNLLLRQTAGVDGPLATPAV